MTLSKKELSALRAHIAKAHPRSSSDRRDEMAQAALHAALERDPSATGEGLVRLARDVLPAVVQAETVRLRRGGRVREPTEEATPPQPIRRLKRRPYLPEGVMSVRDRAGARVIRRETGDPPDGNLLVAARRLASEVLDPILRGEAIQPERRAALLEAYRLLFGGTPDSAWAAALADEIQEARRALLTACEATAQANESLPMETSIGLTKLAGADERYPNLPTKFRVNARLFQRWTDGVRVIFDIVGEIDGEKMVLGQWSTAVGEAPIPLTRATALGLAPAVLLRAISRSGRLGCSPPLPAYVLDVALVALLIERTGFDGGGSRRLSGATIARLLLEPLALADAVEEFAERHAKRLDDLGAAEAALGYREIAAGIRARANSVG